MYTRHLMHSGSGTSDSVLVTLMAVEGNDDESSAGTSSGAAVALLTAGWKGVNWIE